MKKIKYSILISLCLIIGILLIPDNETKIVEIKNSIKMTGATESGFPDENFYKCVIDYYNIKHNTNLTVNDSLTDEQLATINKLICKKKNVSNITGLEKLQNLTELNLMENNLETVDLSNNNNLVYVELSGNPLITSIDLSKNVNLKEIYFRNDSLKNIDISKNINLENLDLGSNELTSIDLNNNINLKYVVLSSNKLSEVDISKNNKLIEFSSSENKITNISLPDTDTIKKLDLHSNKISTINVSKYMNLEKLVLSTNQLTSIDLSQNINIKELYISSNNLTSLNLSTLSKLAHLNAVLNRFSSISIPYPENIINLAIESNWLKNYDFQKFTNLESLRLIDYYIIPVYGTSFEIENLSKYKASDISYKDYILYSDFNKRTKDYINSSKTITGELGKNLEYTLCSTNISNYHNSCGDNIPSNIEFTIDDNVTINNLNSFSRTIYYEGYREFKFISLTSERYTIDEKNSTIDVEADDDNTIINNLKLSLENANIKIDNQKLQILYNGELLREFTLKRVSNPKTGSLLTYILIMLCIGFIASTYFIYINNKKIYNK